jgi:hypothetical protein
VARLPQSLSVGPIQTGEDISRKYRRHCRVPASSAACDALAQRQITPYSELPAGGFHLFLPARACVEHTPRFIRAVTDKQGVIVCFNRRPLQWGNISRHINCSCLGRRRASHACFAI